MTASCQGGGNKDSYAAEGDCTRSYCAGLVPAHLKVGGGHACHLRDAFVQPRECAAGVAARGQERALARAHVARVAVLVFLAQREAAAAELAGCKLLDLLRALGVDEVGEDEDARKAADDLRRAAGGRRAVEAE